MSFIAYKITHRESGKAYVGITTRTLTERWNSHFYKGNGRFGMAVRKYGREAFDVEQIASTTSLSDLMAIERVLIQQHETMVPNGYNLCAGGEGTFEPSEETRGKMSVAALKRTGRIVSNDTRAKIAASLMGHAFEPETLEKMRTAKLGGKASAETKALLSAQRTGRKLRKRTADEIAAMVARLVGKKMPPRSPEQRGNYAASMRAVWATRKAQSA